MATTGPKFARDPDTIASLRAIVASPALYGKAALNLTDDEVVERAERIAAKLEEGLPALTAALRQMAETWAQIAKNLQRELRNWPQGVNPDPDSQPR